MTLRRRSARPLAGRRAGRGVAGGRHGDVRTLPLPPYIHEYPDDPESYQTVYAAQHGIAALHRRPAFHSRTAGGVGEPGVGAAYVTLHVGLDTFQPIREDVIETTGSIGDVCHRSDGTRQAAGRRARNGRLVAVGTTATRVLETVAGLGAFGDTQMASESSGIRVGWQARRRYHHARLSLPGCRCAAHQLHLPRNRCCFDDGLRRVERLRTAYREAVAVRYRFFSFGDAMLVDTQAARDADSEDGG